MKESTEERRPSHSELLWRVCAFRGCSTTKMLVICFHTTSAVVVLTSASIIYILLRSRVRHKENGPWIMRE